jgi:ABC-type phosphate transport system permease subunit
MLGGIIPAIVGALFLILFMIVGMAFTMGVVYVTEYLMNKRKK